MKHVAKQDSLLITYHAENGDKIYQQVLNTSVAEAITLGNLTMKQDERVKSFRVLDVIYNSKFK